MPVPDDQHPHAATPCGERAELVALLDGCYYRCQRGTGHPGHHETITLEGHPVIWGVREETPENPAVWAVVELVGHDRTAGRISDQSRYGTATRLDIPCGDDYLTQYLSSTAIWRVTVVAEDVARRVADLSTPLPVRPWEFPQPAPRDDDQGEEDSDDIAF